MGDTWGIPGSTFLIVYIPALVLAVIGAWRIRPDYGESAGAARRRARRRARRQGGGPAGPQDATTPDAAAESASPEDLALLRGGRTRLVESAVARLLDHGVLRISRDRRLGPTGQAADNDLDAAVLAEVQNGPRRMPAIVRRVSRGAVARRLEASVVDRGLVLAPAAMRGRAALAAALFFSVYAVGVARFIAGAERGAPTGFLSAALAVTLFVGLGLLGSPALVPSADGRAVVHAAEEQRSRLRLTRTPMGPRQSGAVTAAESAAVLVALDGPHGYPDSAIANLLQPPSSSGGGGAAGGVGGGGGGGGCGG